MEVIYYTPVNDHQFVIANFGISVPQWHMEIRNLTVMKSKNGNAWFITYPNFKNKATDAWEKTICFPAKEISDKFLNAVREKVAPYVNTQQGK